MERLNVVAQIVLIVVGAIGFYEARTFNVVQKILSKLGFLKRFIFRSRTVTTLENRTTGELNTTSATATGLISITPPPRPVGTIVGVSEDGHKLIVAEEHSEDLPIPFYVVVAGLAIGLLIFFGRPVTFWLGLPFVEIVRSVTVWSGVYWSWSALLIPMLSLGHILLGLVALSLIYTVALGAILKSALLASDFVATRITPEVFKFMLFILFLGASIVVYI